MLRICAIADGDGGHRDVTWHWDITGWGGCGGGFGEVVDRPAKIKVLRVLLACEGCGQSGNRSDQAQPKAVVS
jgi:hypothetical protein